MGQIPSRAAVQVGPLKHPLNYTLSMATRTTSLMASQHDVVADGRDEVLIGHPIRKAALALLQGWSHTTRVIRYTDKRLISRYDDGDPDTDDIHGAATIAFLEPACRDAELDLRASLPPSVVPTQ